MDQRLDIGFFFGGVGQLSPDEGAMLTLVYDETGTRPPSRGHVDLVTGQFTEIGPSDFGAAPMYWSPDGRFVFWLNNSQVEVFDPATGVSVPFADDLGSVQMFTLRPSG